MPFTENGYLYLASEAGAPILRDNHVDADAPKAPTSLLLDPEGLGRAFPYLNAEGVARGALGLPGEGWFDGYS